MRRIHRSDSMDQILERINMTGDNMQGTSDNKIVNRNTLINKYSLKLADFNKELEYQTQPTEVKVLESIVYTLCVYMVVIVIHIIYEFTDKNIKMDKSLAKSMIMKATVLLITMVLIIAIKKMHDMNYQRVLLFYTLILNVLVNLELQFSYG